MHYQNVCLETIVATLPEESVTSAEIEARLEPLYARLRLPADRLEAMTGIHARRFWPRGMPVGRQSVVTGEKALRQSGLDRRHVGALIHGSVCRDYLEPATACSVHRDLQLPGACLVCDVSNACLGLMNGMVQIANMIELGQIRAGLTVGTECGRALVENTIARLNADQSLTRQDVKWAVASLTIGSGSAAVLLVHKDLSRTGNRLLGGAFHGDTAHCELCLGGYDESAGRTGKPLMRTDSEALLHEGIAVGKKAFHRFLEEMQWTPADVQKTFCHQVGKVQQKFLFEELGLDPAIDFVTYPYLGNTGAVALPITAALGVEQGHVRPGDRVALMGIGSGINAIILGVQWNQTA
ncbi:MAG: 3-oxoacyl-ACP synthase III [Pirellulales bacterium]|nr:3-oxoacyl-ACP synthase III [Pirellulales bacterium]